MEGDIPCLRAVCLEKEKHAPIALRRRTRVAALLKRQLEQEPGGDGCNPSSGGAAEL